MHYLQKQILDALRRVEQMRYSELQPKEVESSHFKYHLDQLISDGCVERVERGVYALTTEGASFVDRLSDGQTTLRDVPKPITYTVLRRGNELLLWKKDKEPYRGMVNFVGGKMHRGESPAESAAREVHEKLGIICKPEQVGVASIKILESQQLVTHAHAFVFVADVSVTDVTESIIVENNTTILKRDDLAPDFQAVFEAIEKHQNQPFAVDITIQCKNDFTECEVEAFYAGSVSMEANMAETIERIKAHIDTVEDFPKPGIKFYDIAPLLGSSALFAETIELMADDIEGVTKVAAFDARGFLFGVPLAQRLKAGFVMLRKPGKLPGDTDSVAYDLEYGSDGLELQSGKITAEDRVVLVDDVIATGGTALAGVELVRNTGAEIANFTTLIDLKELGGSQRIIDAGVAVRAVLTVEGGEL